MASQSAVLSVLLEANTSEATAKLTKFDRQLAAVTEQSRKGIEARLGATFDREAFTKYEAAVSKAARVSKDRAAFKAELGANFSGRGFTEYSRAVDKSTKSTKEASTHTDRFSHSIHGLATSLLAAGGAFAAFETAKEAINSTLELGHATERLSAATGLDIKEASTWIETMKVRGVQAKAVSMAFITLSRNVRTAQDADTAHVTAITQLIAKQKLQRDSLQATGASHQKLTQLEKEQQAALDKLSGPSTNKAIRAFAELGVSQDTLRSKSDEKVLLAVADGMAKIEDPARRAALAQQIFGRGAQALIPILKEGRQGVEDALAATQRYGAYLPQNVRTLKGAVDAQHNLNLAMDGLKISFTTAVLPALTQGAEKLLNFVAQMRSGQGAGGQFAAAISGAFHTVKTAVTNVVTAMGGLGNTVRIAVGAFVAAKIVQFGIALQGVFTLIRSSPVGAFFTAVGLLAGVFLALSNRQHTAAQTAREVADAWDKAKDSADQLRDANLQVVQAKLDHIKADQALTQAQRAVTRAADTYGKNSPQYKQAEEDLAQAKIDSKRASNDLEEATRSAGKAKRQDTSDTRKAIGASQDAIASDRSHIKSLSAMITTLDREHAGQQQNTTGANALKDAQQQLSGATHKLAQDQQNLNAQLNAMPGRKLTDIQVEVDFASNISNAIDQIAKQVGGHFAPLQSRPAFAPGHYTGGLVTQPGYFAGEEAPQHPEVILATNPAYRKRNLGLFAKAGNMLGVPGFAQGGLSSMDSRVVGDVSPWTSQVASTWMKPKAASWVKGVVTKMQAAAAAAGGTGPSPLAGPPGVQRMIAAANEIASHNYNYEWGGGHNSGFAPTHGVGHGSGPGIGYDCSGAVSRMLHANGLLGSPLVSGGFMNYGSPGAGKWITIYSSPTHVFSEISGRYFGTSGQNPGGGANWIPTFPGNIGAITHPTGFAEGGIFKHSKQKTFGAFDPSQFSPRDQAFFVKTGLLPGLAKGGIFGKAKAAAARIPRFLQGGVYTASEYDSHGTGAGGLVSDVQSVPGFAELSNPPSSDNWSALGHLPFGSKINVTYRGKTITIPKLDVGAGGSAIPPATVRAVDLTMPAAHLLNFPGLANVTVSAPGGITGGGGGGFTVTTSGGGSSGGSSTSGGGGKPAKPAPKFVPTKVPKLKLPFKLSNVPAGATPIISGLVGELNKIYDPDRGTIAALTDRIGVVGQIDDQKVSEYQTAHPATDTSTGLIETSSTDASGNTTTHHTVDQKFVDMRVAQLTKLIIWQTQVRDYLKAARRKIDILLHRLHQALEIRRRFAQKIHDDIERNVARIQELTAQEKQPKISRRHKSDLAASIQALKNQNKQLGGNEMRAGNAGVLGRVGKEITSLNDTASTMRDNRLAIVGASGIGGTLATSKLDLKTTADELAVISPKSVQAALAAATSADIAAGGGTTPAVDDSGTIQMLQQLLDQAHLATSVSQEQLSILQATPPFGGSFAQGGVVPGPFGAPRTIIAHAGERITPTGESGRMRVVVEDHRTRVFYDDVEQVVNHVTRGQARNATRTLPGHRARF